MAHGDASPARSRELDAQIPPRHPSRLLRASNCLVFLLFLGVSITTAVLGNSDVALARRLPTPLTPASWAYMVWAAILGLQALGVAYPNVQHGYSPDGMKARYVNGIGWGWQVCWWAEMARQLALHLDSPWAMLLCLACVLLGLAALGRTLYNLYRLKEAHGSLSSVLLYVAFFLPTSVAAAWLSAVAANAALMVPAAWGARAHLEAPAVVLLAAVSLLGLAVVQRFRDSAYGLTLVWAFVAIYGQQQATLIRVVCLVCLSLNTLSAIFSMLRRKQPGAATELSDVRQPLSRIATV